MKSTVFFLCFLLGIYSCHQKKKIDEKALAFNKRATNIFIKNFDNTDSLNFALSLVDSAIKVQPDYVNFYSMKINLLSKLDRYGQIVSVYDRILELRKNNCLFLMGKGIAFEHLNKLDSANYYYHLALDHFDDVKWNREADKEVEKAILFGILKDTINFNRQLNLFKTKYSTEKDFEPMYESLKSFDRNEAIFGDELINEDNSGKGE